MTTKMRSSNNADKVHVVVAAAALRKAKQPVMNSGTQIDLLSLALAHMRPRQNRGSRSVQKTKYCRVCGDRIHSFDADLSEQACFDAGSHSAQLCEECEAIAQRLRDPQFPWKESK